MSQPETSAAPSRPVPSHPWWPYVVPMAAYLGLTSLEGFLPASNGGPHPFWYPLAYAAKVVIVTGLLVAGRRAWGDLRPRPDGRAIALAVVIGLVVTVGWVGLERLPYPRMPLAGGRAAFDPFVLHGPERLAFLAVRFLGLVAMVPVMEELFWRSFLLRLIQDPDSDFERVPVGRVTPMAAAITSALFAAAHPEWLPALLTGLAWAWLLGKTRSLSACVISHAVTNLGLGIYVLTTGHWELW
jgi:CAAX prenyl protease-like protein